MMKFNKKDGDIDSCFWLNFTFTIEDSLLLTSLTLSNGGKKPPRDAFSFVLKVDGVNRIEANYSNVSIDGILKVLRPYFPKERRDYDFWEFFQTREESDLPDTPANGLHKVFVYNHAFTIGNLNNKQI